MSVYLTLSDLLIAGYFSFTEPGHLLWVGCHAEGLFGLCRNLLNKEVTIFNLDNIIYLFLYFITYLTNYKCIEKYVAPEIKIFQKVYPNPENVRG